MRFFTNRPTRLRLPLVAVISLTLVSAPAVGVARFVDPNGDEAAYRAEPALPDGDTRAGKTGAETSAISLAATLGAVPVDGSGEACPRDRLEVSWKAPNAEFAEGAHVLPVGPPPTDDTRAVNGIVVCDGSTYAYMGFVATFANGRWSVTAVPYVGDEESHFVGEGRVLGDSDPHDHHDDHAGADGHAATPVPAPAAPSSTMAAAGSSADLSFLGGIEGYAPYEPQRICAPDPKPGAVALRNLLLAQYAGTRSMGIARSCTVGGRSEHKEGRALDWGVLVSRPAERAAADHFVDQLLATDAAGNRHALARRMGVMYMIWNGRIWSAFRASEGWRPYVGVSAHTDHVHVSLSWAGAMGRTSFWSGKVDPTAVFGSTWSVLSTSTATHTSTTSTKDSGDDHDDDGAARRDHDGHDGHGHGPHDGGAPPEWAPAHGWRAKHDPDYEIDIAALAQAIEHAGKNTEPEPSDDLLMVTSTVMALPSEPPAPRQGEREPARPERRQVASERKAERPPRTLPPEREDDGARDKDVKVHGRAAGQIRRGGR